MRLTSRLLAIGSAFALCACSSLLGDFSTGDDGGVESGLADGPAGSDGTVSDGTSGAEGGGTCAPQSERCATNGVQTCGANGMWGAAVACPPSQPFCNGPGVCGACADGTTQCSGGGVQTCVAGAWLAPVPCMNGACSMGACAGTCAPNTTQCSGNAVQNCDATGHWGTPVPCTGAACVGGACKGACTPGATSCSSGGVQTCDGNGMLSAPVACGTHQKCTESGTTAVCTCNSDPTCNAAGSACKDPSTLASCGQDAQGCWYASSTSPCSNGACFGSPGSAQCCTNGCTSGATQCGGAGLQTCQAQGNGCTAWNAGSACGPHQSCTGVSGSAACTCNADPLCASAGTVCASTTSYATCAQDAQNCFYQASTSPCGANSTCQGGACGCKSGFTACGSSCVDINNDSLNCGGCGKACPVLSAPSSGSTCSASQCTGYVGGYVSAGGGPLLSNPDAQTVFAVKAVMPAVSGTFQGVGGVMGSQNTSGSTQMIFGLYGDSNGAPGPLLFYTNTPDPTLSFADPSTLMTVKSGGGLYMNGFNNTLAANTTYWVYMKAGTDGSTGNIAGVSSSPCLAASWINVDPPASFTPSGSCPGDFQIYLIVSFP